MASPSGYAVATQSISMLKGPGQAGTQMNVSRFIDILRSLPNLRRDGMLRHASKHPSADCVTVPP